MMPPLPKSGPPVGGEAALPVFQSKWEGDFKKTTFNQREMSWVRLISATYFLGHFTGTVGVRRTDDVAGSNTWLLLTWLPELLCGLQNLLWLAILNTSSLRPFCIKRYDVLCTWVILSNYAATIVPAFVWEIRLAEKQSLRYNDTRLVIDFASFPPNRTCFLTGRDLDTTDLRLIRTDDEACQEFVLSGSNFITYVFWNLLPRICRVRAFHALVTAFSTFGILIMLSLAVGFDAWAIAGCALFQLTTGLATAAFCMNGDQRSRDKYAMGKATQFAAEQNRALLYTLIPQNVVERLATHTGDRLLGRDITLCTVMFCSLETHIPLALLDSVYIAFDAAVQRYGMFKYQHVGPSAPPPPNPCTFPAHPSTSLAPP